MTNGEPKRHHYVPRFYLRRFACSDDVNKIMVTEKHLDASVTDRKSIDWIGYEDAFHDHIENGVVVSIERDINRTIETPFANSSTWLKISTGACETLSKQDTLPIYTFAQHLQRRNLETLRFIERENEHVQSEGFSATNSEQERGMHRWIAATTDGARAFFCESVLDTILPPDARQINVMVCRSPIALRSSTNPTLIISHPGEKSLFGSLFESLRTWWLTLDRYWGVFIIAGGPPGFANTEMPRDAARVINRRYLVQHQNSLSVRYLIAHDEHLEEDLVWAGHRFEKRTKYGFRYRKIP